MKNSKKRILIVKASGEREFFSKEKLKASLRKIGVSEEILEKVAKEVEKKLKDGMTTKQIYRLAFFILKKKSPIFASKYSLKKAIFEMGPSGHPFEKLVAEIFKSQGYKVATNKILKGFCIWHEVDVIAENQKQIFLVECKFHHLPGIKSDAKVALYVFARFKDIEKEWERKDKKKKLKMCLVTNTKLTKDAISFGECQKMKIIGWNYPFKNNLQELLEKNKLYPITCLTSLKKYQKVDLLKRGIIVCKKINKKLLEKLNIPPSQTNQVLSEIKEILRK